MDINNGVIYGKDIERNETWTPTLQPNGHLAYIGQDIISLSEIPSSIKGLLVKRLDLSFNRLKSLQGLDRFCNVEELILDNNELGDDIEFPPLDRLHTLSINKNNIIVLSPFLDKCEDKMPSLKYLSLLGNEACPNQLSDIEKNDIDYNRYRHFVLYRLPNLKFLDSSQVTNNEKREAAKIGKELQVIRPKSGPGISVDDTPATTNPFNYKPLPPGQISSKQKATTYGKCKYVYYGKHSEGNRFIRNNDL